MRTATETREYDNGGGGDAVKYGDCRKGQGWTRAVDNCSSIDVGQQEHWEWIYRKMETATVTETWYGQQKRCGYAGDCSF